MTRRLKIALVGLALAVYLVTLVVKLPAALALPWALAGTSASIHDPNGTLWQGHASAVTQGARTLRDVTWQLQPLSLLGLTAAGRLAAELPNGRLESRVQLGLGNYLRLAELSLDADLDTLLTWAGRAAYTGLATGQIGVTASEVIIENARPTTADGVITWRGAGIGPGGNIPLGDLALRITPKGGGGLRGELTSENGPLRLSGKATLSADGVLTGQLVLAPRTKGDPAAQRVARQLQLRNPNGRNVVAIRREPGEAFSVRQR